MTSQVRGRFRRLLLAASAIPALFVAGLSEAQTVTTDGPLVNPAPLEEIVISVDRTTRSSVELGSSEIQKILPGVSPLKAIETLPGVVFMTADPWGNNEQNESLFVHGFNTQQLGYTMDDVPLGDQQYGNYNGLSPSRAVISENVSRVTLESGAGSLGVASTSNLGGAIETYSRNPSQTFEADLRETLGSYATNRTFARLDTGEFGNNNTATVSYLHQDARAWDFDGQQEGDQVNGKYIHAFGSGKLTLFADWQSKVEPNEDAIAVGNQQTAAAANFIPYKRAFYYPNLSAYETYLQSTGLAGSPPTAQGNNFSNYFSAAQREDWLTYAKYDTKLADSITWSTQVYEHYDYGRGIVAGPINQGGLPGLFGIYYPGQVVGGNTSSAGSLANISNVFGGTGIEVRTTEYRINREGAISALNATFGQHEIEFGFWYEHNESATHRVWYPFSAANNDLTPYEVPDGPKAFTQYYNEMFTNDGQFHLQDQWHVLPTLVLQAGFKASLQNAYNTLPVQQQNLLAGNPYGLKATNPPVTYPVGTIDSNNWFLPQFGAVWDITDIQQVFVNIQNNERQFIPYGAGSSYYGTSPWSLGSQAAFNLFKQTVHPETSWTYEVGVRTSQPIGSNLLTSIDGQASAYHVDFYNRLLNVAAYNFINPNPAILVNVGGVTTNGADVAATLNFGSHVHLYDGISYNKSTYNSNYVTGTPPTTVDTSGKWVPLTPDWTNKTVLSTTFGAFSGQLTGDYVGRRYATYLNDETVKPSFQMGLEAGYQFQTAYARSFKLSGNITNLTNTKGYSTVNVTGNSGGYTAYPIAPIMGFVTLEAAF